MADELKHMASIIVHVPFDFCKYCNHLQIEKEDMWEEGIGWSNAESYRCKNAELCRALDHAQMVACNKSNIGYDYGKK